MLPNSIYVNICQELWKSIFKQPIFKEDKNKKLSEMNLENYKK